MPSKRCWRIVTRTTGSSASWTAGNRVDDVFLRD
jgi:hypothetical protein